MPKKLLLISQSGDMSSSPIGAFIACLIVFILDTNLEEGEDGTRQFRAQFKTWARTAAPFAKKLGISRTFGKMVQTFNSGEGPIISEAETSAFGAAFLKCKSKLAKDTSIPAELLQLTLTCFRYLKKDTDSSWNRIEKQVSLLQEPRLTSVFVNEDHHSAVEIDGVNAVSASQKIRPLYKKLMGNDVKDNYFIRHDKAKELREKYPGPYAEYSKYAKIIAKEVQRRIHAMVRSSGVVRIPVDEVVKSLDKDRILHNMPRNFVGGTVDEKAQYFTKEGKQLMKAPIGTVQFNPRYNPATDNTYVLHSLVWGKNGNGKVRTITMDKSNKEKRHGAAQDFIDHEATYRKKWLKDLDRKGSKEQIVATIVEMLWATSGRVGGKGNESAGEPTYGLTTLHADHIKVKPGKIEFNYIGKKNAPQPAVYRTNTTEGKKIEAIVKKLLADKSPDENVFTWRDKDILRNSVNIYLKRLGIKMSAHGFRRVAGTKKALEILANNPFKKMKGKGTEIKESDVNRWFKTEMTKVGEVLHHRTGEKVTGMTAVKSYIDPSVVAEFYQNLGLRVPKFVPKK